jgi:hypothetical protein
VCGLLISLVTYCKLPFGSFCGYNLSDRKKSSILAKNPLIIVAFFSSEKQNIITEKQKTHQEL